MLADDDKKFLPKITVQALVDSGTTNSMLHPRVASSLKLKINYSKKYTGTGAGGGFEYVISEPLEIELLGQKYDIQFDIPLDENFAWACILGHNSIFKFSKIVFKTYKEEFDIFIRADIN